MTDHLVLLLGSFCRLRRLKSLLSLLQALYIGHDVHIADSVVAC